MKKKSPVVHFEMAAEDIQRMVKFYENVFGWDSQEMGEKFGNYVVMTTTETGENQFPKEPGRINGGFFPKTLDVQPPNIVVAVDDIHEAMKEVTAAGGTVLGGMKPGEPDDIPGIGLYAAFIDTEGNRVAMLQPAPMM